MSDEFLTQCTHRIGALNVLTGDDMAGYLTDWRRRFTGHARAVLRPASTDEVAALVQLCVQHRKVGTPAWCLVVCQTKVALRSCYRCQD
jgi:FAD/FMN-containing dehydrogenase